MNWVKQLVALTLLWPLLAALASDPSVVKDTPLTFDELWGNALAATDREDFAGAVGLYRRFIDEASRKSVQAPEAHYNLAQSLWRVGDVGQAVFHLLSSINQRISPARVYQEVELLSQLQARVGLYNGLLTKKSFFLYFLMGPTAIILASSAAGWVLIFLAVHWLLFGKRRKRSPLYAIGATFGLLCFLAGAVGLMNRLFWDGFGVVDGKGKEASFFGNPAGHPDQKLGDLPSGIVVSIRDTVDGFVRIDEPVAGWVSTADLLRL